MPEKLNLPWKERKHIRGIWNRKPGEKSRGKKKRSFGKWLHELCVEEPEKRIRPVYICLYVEGSKLNSLETCPHRLNFSINMLQGIKDVSSCRAVCTTGETNICVYWSQNSISQIDKHLVQLNKYSMYWVRTPQVTYSCLCGDMEVNKEDTGRSTAWKTVIYTPNILWCREILLKTLGIFIYTYSINVLFSKWLTNTHLNQLFYIPSWDFHHHSRN